jgi:hypothetical protein
MPHSTRLKHTKKFYELIEELAHNTGGPHPLANIFELNDLPNRGVYFFFEDTELRTTSANNNVPFGRVVRVGTHALKAGANSTVKGRLKQHHGNTGNMVGNHRGSIFRSILGTCFLNDFKGCDTWGIGQAANAEVRNNEQLLEERVSQYIRQMQFLVLNVDDEPGRDSNRGFIEQNSIALLSNYTANNEQLKIDPPSNNWLGFNCNRPLVQQSGLWNQQHVDINYDATFLDVFEQYLRA